MDIFGHGMSVDERIPVWVHGRGGAHGGDIAAGLGIWSGTLYPALDRLERAGVLAAASRTPHPGRTDGPGGASTTSRTERGLAWMARESCYHRVMDMVSLFDALAARAAQDAALVEAHQAHEEQASRSVARHPGRQVVSLLDCVSAAPCPNCGTEGWIIDGHEGDNWLLCLDLVDKGCVHTKPIPRWFEVREMERT